MKCKIPPGGFGPPKNQATYYRHTVPERITIQGRNAVEIWVRSNFRSAKNLVWTYAPDCNAVYVYESVEL